ncbi:MAG TPA: mechanosensitive ion channel family protein [Burkholderiales bacterium]|nr:mechanosensitive ion channel family protein [Burkholderiales bacterium]
MNAAPSPFAFWSSAAPWFALVAFGLVIALLHARPHERATFLNTLWLFLAGIAGEAAAALIWKLGFAEAAAAVHTIFRFVSVIALIRLGGFAAFRLLLPFAGSHPPRIVEDLAIVGAYVIYGFAQLRGAGLDLSSIVTTSAILTAVIAFAMQDTLGNVLAGVAVQLDHSVRIGDWIRVDNVSGRVRDIRWRSTLIETRNWETVVIPNSLLMKARVEILGQREGAPLQWRRMLDFMVDPGVPPARVIAIVEDEMRELSIPNVARTPAPSCVLKRFEEGNLLYQLRYFLTDLLEDDLTDSMVRVHLFASLQRAGIRVAEPQRTVHAVARDQAHAETVRRRELTRRLQALSSVPPFAALSEEDKADIAERLQYAPFARGDVITKQGNKAHWLYILAFGEADVLYEPPGGVLQPIGTLHAGQFFGEMALVTGEARAATVIAKTDVECYRLDRASFQELLAGKPQIAEEIGRVMGGRRGDLDSARQAFTEVAPTAEAGVRFVSRIRRFFGKRNLTPR